MIVAVSLSVYENPTYLETRDTLSHDWVRFLDGLGATPVLVPNSITDPAGYCRELNVDGILLTSGNDLGPLPSEEWPQSLSVSPDRDRTEYALLDFASETPVPLMGVCRGIQTINAYFGGGVVRDLLEWTDGEGHVAVEHRVEIIDPSYRQRLGTSSFNTNSYHDHGVAPGGLAPALKAVAVSEKGVVEALRHSDLPILATQWHPERKNPEPGPASALFRHWLEWCVEGFAGWSA